MSSRNVGGGALYFFGQTGSSLSIDASTFTVNNGTRGGAIFTSGVSTITVENSKFSQNLADLGGAMNVNDVQDLVLRKLSAENGAACTWDGGAINAKGNGKGELIIDQSHFMGNSALVDDGGAGRIEKVSDFLKA